MFYSFSIFLRIFTELAESFPAYSLCNLENYTRPTIRKHISNIVHPEKMPVSLPRHHSRLINKSVFFSAQANSMGLVACRGRSANLSPLNESRIYFIWLRQNPLQKDKYDKAESWSITVLHKCVAFNAAKPLTRPKWPFPNTLHRLGFMAAH